jgi:hypothetical protein
MKNILKKTLFSMAASLLLSHTGFTQTLVWPSGIDQPWLSTSAGVLNGINTALIDYPVARQLYGQLAACAHGATMGTPTPVNGVQVNDLTYGTTVSVPYPAGIYDMASVPDVIIGNNLNPGHDVNTEFIMAVSFVNNNTPQQIETDFFDIVYTGPGVFTVTYNSSQYLPLPAAFALPGGTVHMDVIAETKNTVYGRPQCDRFFTVFDGHDGGGTWDIFAAYGTLSGYNYILGTTDITDTFQTADNYQPDVAGIQLQTGGGPEFDAAIFTWVTQSNVRLHTMTWRPVPDVTLATGTYWPASPGGLDYLAHPRIDANDDYATNSSVLNSNYKVVYECQLFGGPNMTIESFDNLSFGFALSSLIGIPGGPYDHFAPSVAFGASGPLGSQYLTTQTTHDGTAAPLPGDRVVMQPVEEANPTFVAWGPLGSGSAQYNFVVNNTGGSGGSPTDMIPTNYTNATSTPCNYVNDTSLVAWADYSGGNYNIWYKRSGYDWGSTGHYYRPVIKQTDDRNAFSLAPNPATTAITLQATGAYQIIDMLGRELLQGTLAEKKQTIDISSLSEGNYIVSFKEDCNKKVYRKFTKL